MRVIRNTGQNVSPSDDGRLYDKAFTDGLFNSPSITSLGANLVQIGSMYGILCGRDFTADAQQINVELPTADTATGYIYIKYNTATDVIISVESALAPFTVTYEDINTSGTVCEMIIATYTASSVAVTSLTASYPTAQTEVNKTLAGSLATIETSPATANHSVGEYIVYNGQLYKVTTAITAGQSLTVGTNISATSVMDENHAEEFTLVSNQGSAYTGYGVYNPESKAVIINFRGSTTGNISMGVAMMTVPEKYRPTSIKYGSAFIFTDVSAITGEIALNTNGTITQTASNYLRNISGTFMYVLD